MKHHNKIAPVKPGLDPTVDQTVLARLAALKAMSVKDLKAEWEKLIGSAAQICARFPSPPMADSDCSGRESARVAAHELVECVECRLFLELGHLPPRRRAVWIEQQ